MSDVREFALPDLGEGLEEGEIAEWHVSVGELLELNQPVADIETAKAVVTVPSPFSGRVVDRLGDVGDVLPVGAVLLRVDVDADLEERPASLVGYGHAQPVATSGPGPRVAPPRPAAHTRSGEPAPAGGRGVLAAPAVRGLARDLGVELAEVSRPSGPSGTVTREDVQAAARRGPRPGEVVPIRGVRRLIVEKVERAHSQIPSASCSRDADLTALFDARDRLARRARRQGAEVTITPFAFVLRATVLALRRFPVLNAQIDREAGEIRLFEHVDLGFAADTPRGLVVPTIEEADTRSTLQLATAVADLAGRAREGSIHPGELAGGTFTVTNYGAFGIDDGVPIINHPEVAVLGLGAIRARPWVVRHADGDPSDVGELAIRRVARMTLVFDHRVCDGAEAGRFLSAVTELCESPRQLLDEDVGPDATRRR